ncbi:MULTISPECIES: DNA repair and recombination protein RadA [Halobacterium]|uniref:DNA repair and recombination protein RadA n=6 Tax=Halobacterium salinarum TaxID=2242 RepID=RADA_HALSA|nr:MULTISPECIES: DNA repair and recombination protein RadA [Halobacterium]B0R7Y4.1 RecName: Full=DNA repair and recombination protein RadA [Halobacterium salinarum R1]Q9HMM4.2 RecName: Full=DNA repair and recombination protein RadA [Halobacterium salinarum NRC-1]MBB6089522.1 DNA repair protein RadA [Halobacterium salinarum]MCF2164272.1 DNA repair and recombination protein RadA [Halobacterium salinarum]MCF2167059.1 DNA repair and recombination protein RadA [Halobacterium salinarum]MCF2207255.1
MPESDLEELPGVGPATAEKLRDNGFDAFQSLAVANSAELSNTADIGESTAADVIQAAREAADVGGFETGATVLERREQIGKLTWNIPEVDDLLGGGVETQSITEVYGEFGAGKSQVTHQLAVNVQLPTEYGGLHGRAVFIDSEDTFRPERIDDMVRGLSDETLQAAMEAHEIEGSTDDEDTLTELVDAFLDKIHVAKGFNSNHQMLLAEKAKEIASEHEDGDWPVRMLTVDSLTAHFRAEYVGRGELADRQQKLNKHLHDLEKVGNLYNAAVLVTNQVQSNPDAFFGDPTKPIGGNILGHKSTFRMYLRKSKNDKRIVKLVDAPNLADGEAVMRVQDEGLKPE